MGEKKDQVLTQIGITICVGLILLVAWVFFLEAIVLDLAGISSNSRTQQDQWVFSLASLFILSCALVYPCKKLVNTLTQLNQAEKKLKEEQSLFRAFHSVDNSLVIITDSANKVSQINQKTGQVLGYRGKDLLGKDWVQVIIPEKARAKVRKSVQSVTADKSKPLLTFQSPSMTRDQKERLIEWQATAYHDEKGVLQGGIFSGIDLTDQERLKSEINTRVKQYEPQIKLLNGSLTDNRKKLETEVKKNSLARSRLQFWVGFDKALLFIQDDVHSNENEIDRQIEGILRHLGNLTQANHGYIFLFENQATQMKNTHIWSAEDPNLRAEPDEFIPLDTFPWFKEKIESKEIIHARKLDEFPDSASYEKEVFQSQGVKSLINVPLIWHNHSIGYIGLEATTQEKSWDSDEICMLRIFSKTLAPLLHSRIKVPVEAEPSLPPAKKVIDENTIEGALAAELELDSESAPQAETSDTDNDSKALDQVKAEYETELQALKDQIQGQQTQWQTLETELNETRERLQSEMEHRQKSENELTEIRNNLHHELIESKELLTTAQEQVTEQTEEKERLAKELANLKEQSTNIPEEIEPETDDSEKELELLREEHAQNLRAAEEALQGKTDELESLQTRLESETEIKQKLESQLNQINQLLSRQEQENMALDMAHAMLQSELDDLIKAQQEFDETLMEMEEKEKSFGDQQREIEEDLTIQKQMVDSLEGQIKQYNKLSLPIFTIDHEGTITNWNEGAENELGPSCYEAVGQPLTYILDEGTSLQLEEEILAPLFEQRTLKVTLPLNCIDGTVKKADLNFTPFVDNSGGIIYITFPQEKAVSLKSDSLTKHAGLFVFQLSSSFEVLDISPSVTQLFGWERQDVFEKEFFSLILPPEEAVEFREDIIDVFKSRPSSDYESAIKIDDKQSKTILWNLAKQENESGDVAGIFVVGQDLTELRETEKLFKQNESLLNSIVDHSMDGFVTIDENGIIQTFNSGAERAFGYRSEEVVGQNINILMPEPYRSEHTNYISNYLMTGTAKVVGKPPREFMALKKDGTPFHIEVSVREMYQDYRRLFVGIVRDVSRRKAVEQALKESEEKFHKVLSAESDAIVILNTSTKRIIEANEAAVELFGYERDEILRLKLTDISTEPEKSVTNGNGGGMGRVSRTPLRFHKKKDGTVFPAEVSASTFVAHDQKLNLRVIRDISFRVRIEENLRESEEHLQHILNNTPAAVYLKDSEGRYRTINRQFENLFRVTQEEVKGKTDHQIFPNDLASEFEQADQKVLESGTTVESQETILYSDGAHIFDTVKFPLRNSSGVLYGLVGILSDITQRTRLEEELRNIRNHLDEMVSKRTAELEKTQIKKIRVEKLKATAQLAGVVAQQINNPIHGIRNILEQVGDRVQMEDIHKNLMNVAIQECGRVEDLLAKLKDCHAPDAGPQESMDVNQVIEEALTTNQDKLGETITLEKHFAQGLPQVAGSTDQIKQALGQLIQNAEEALPDHKGRILIATERENNWVKIHVQDSGCGIPPENLDAIFDPFFTTKSAYKRSGLGLLLTLGVIKNHHGEIEVKSQPGKGTTFTITLPLKV